MMKRFRRSGNGTQLRLGILLFSALGSTLLTGCGGGGTSRVASKTPTKATKQHVQSVNILSLRNMSASGIPNGIFFAMRGGAVPPTASNGGTGAAGGVATGGATSSSNTSANTSANTTALPQTGQFLQNIASTSIANRTKAIRTMIATHGRGGQTVTRDSGAGSSPGSPGSIGVDPPLPAPTFYFDYYLGLWVDIVDATGSTTFNLYVDEAKTQPAGIMTTTWPTGNTYPLIYSSNYGYTAGNQAGASGSYTTTYNQDGSGTSSYQNVYSDGSKDSGTSSWTGTGTYTWTGRTDNADKSYSSMSGTFHSDGSGGMRFQDSNGYVADFTYNADGSGHGFVSGPDAGLPATIVWDAMGNTTITYADGTSEYIQGWGFGIVTPVAAAGSGGATTSGGTVSSSTNSGGNSGK